MYNEDWLFCLKLFARGGEGSLALAGHVTQVEPDILFGVHRARMEELGDILAESLMNLAGGGQDLRKVPDKDFWKEAIRERGRLVRDLATLLDEGTGIALTPSHSARARFALEETLAWHRRLEGDLDAWSTYFTDYVRAWWADDDRWSEYMENAWKGILPATLSARLPKAETLAPAS
jgi:hypothetical protein